MSALQGQVDQWFTDNPNATGQQIVDVIKSVGGLDAHAGLTDILASRYGVAPNEVTNYYNTYATSPAMTANIANTPGMGAQGIGVNTASAVPNSYFAANPDVAAAFQQNSYGMTPEQFAATHYQNFGANEQRAAPTMGALSQVANIRGDDAMPHPNDDDPSAIINTYKSIYGVDPTQEQLAGLTQQFGSEFDPSEVARFVYDDTSLRDDPRGAVKTLQQQILDQGFTGKWSGEGFGSAEANAADMARMLASAGITDINQFGKVNVAADAAVTPVYGTRKAFDPEYGEYEERYITGYTDASGKAVDPSLVKTAYDEYSGTTDYLAPVGTKQVFGNKATGVALDPRYSKAEGNIFSGTFAGDGSTGYGVQFRADGSPVFYTQYMGSSNDLAQLMQDPLIGTIVQAAASYFGGPLGTAALNLAAGKDIGDVAKATLASYVAGEVGKYVSGSESVVDALGKTGANVAGRVAGSVATGGGEEGALNALITGGVNAAMPEIQSMIPGYSNLPPFGKEFVNNAIASTLQDGNLSEQDLIRAAVRAGTTAVRTATNNSGALASVEDMGPTSIGTNITGPLADAGEGAGDVTLPSGIQTASLDGGLPTRIEVGGPPIFAEDPRAANIRPPAGYRVLSGSEQEDRLISQGIGDLPSKYETVRPVGSYYDSTLNAWLAPSGEFDAATNVEDFSKYFGQSSLSDSDVADIYQGVKTGDVTAEDLYYLTGKSGNPLSAGEIQRIVSDISRSGGRPTGGLGGDGLGADGGLPTTDLGELVIVDKRPNPVYDYGEPNPEYDFGEPNPEYDFGETNLEDGPVDTPTTTTPATNPPGLTTTNVVTPKTTTTQTTKKTSNTSMPSSLESSITTTPQVLRGAAREKAMRLAALRQLFDSLTPEMQEILMERGITAPPEQNLDEKSEKELPEKSSENLSPKIDDQGVTTKFFAGGGTITELQGMKDRFNPNLRTTPSMLAAAPIDPKEPPLKLMSLRHLRQGIAKPPKPISELAQGGLPQKYAQAAPEGHKPEFITGLTGYYASGKGTGQSDDIPAMLHDGDYVIDADAVAAFGDGSSKAGAQALSQFQSKVPHKMGTGGKAVAAKIADGEYVFPEAFVSALGGGSNEKGAKMLDAMREELRAHKRSAPTSKIPPKAKSPLDYLRMAKG